MTQTTLSAGKSGIGYKRARDIAAPAHLGALIAAKPRIQAVIQDGVTAGLLPKHPLETRLAAVIETALSTHLDAPVDEDKPRQSCTFRRLPRQQKWHGSDQLEDCRGLTSQTRQDQPSNTPAPPPRMKTARTCISQRPGRADSVRRRSKCSFHGLLIGLDSGV